VAEGTQKREKKGKKRKKKQNGKQREKKCNDEGKHANEWKYSPCYFYPNFEKLAFFFFFCCFFFCLVGRDRFRW
jgi:hypothetical protein